MGQHTTFVGYAVIEPPLSPSEVDLIGRLNRTRRCDAPGGALRIASDRQDEALLAADPDAYSRPAPDAPGFWCPWVSCDEGHCLNWDGMEKPYSGEQWLRWIIDVLLRPDADVVGTDFAREHQLTCDHILDGIIVGERRETAEVYALEVEANIVRRRCLMQPMPGLEDWEYDTYGGPRSLSPSSCNSAAALRIRAPRCGS